MLEKLKEIGNYVLRKQLGEGRLNIGLCSINRILLEK
jgi:hypothetical protein